MKTSPFSSKIALLAITLTVSNFSYSQITNSSQLKTACETSAGNIVTVSQSIKISELSTPSITTLINCPCTLVIINEQKVEFEKVNIQFTGAFSIQSAGKGEAVSVNSSIKAPSISINLGGESSQISTSQSFLQAIGMTKSWKADTSENLTTEGLKTGSYTIQVIKNKTGQKSSMKFIVD